MEGKLQDQNPFLGLLARSAKVTCTSWMSRVLSPSLQPFQTWTMLFGKTCHVINRCYTGKIFIKEQFFVPVLYNIFCRYVKAIESGTLPPNLVSQRPGPLNHSRWLTLGIRLLILYTRTANPSDGLKRIVTYVVQVYAVMWFRIKSNSKFTQVKLQ